MGGGSSKKDKAQAGQDPPAAESTATTGDEGSSDAGGKGKAEQKDRYTVTFPAGQRGLAFGKLDDGSIFVSKTSPNGSAAKLGVSKGDVLVSIGENDIDVDTSLEAAKRLLKESSGEVEMVLMRSKASSDDVASALEHDAAESSAGQNLVDEAYRTAFNALTGGKATITADDITKLEGDSIVRLLLENGFEKDADGGITFDSFRMVLRMFDESSAAPLATRVDFVFDVVAKSGKEDDRLQPKEAMAFLRRARPEADVDELRDSVDESFEKATEATGNDYLELEDFRDFLLQGQNAGKLEVVASLNFGGAMDDAARPPSPQPTTAVPVNSSPNDGSTATEPKDSAEADGVYIVTFESKPFGLRPGEESGVAIVNACTPGGAADQLGIRAGDIIVRVGDKFPNGKKDVVAAMKKAKLPLSLLLRRPGGQ